MVAKNQRHTDSHHGRKETLTSQSHRKDSSRRFRRQKDDDDREVGRARGSSPSKRFSRGRYRSCSPVKHNNGNKHSVYKRSRSRSRPHKKNCEDLNQSTGTRSRRFRNRHKSKSRERKTHHEEQIHNKQRNENGREEDEGRLSRNYKALIANNDTFDTNFSSQSSIWRKDPTLWVAEKIVSWCISGQVRIQRINNAFQRASCSPTSDDVRDDQDEVEFREVRLSSDRKESSTLTKARANRDKTASIPSQATDKETRNPSNSKEEDDVHPDSGEKREIGYADGNQQVEGPQEHSTSNRELLEIKKPKLSRSSSQRKAKRSRPRSSSKQLRSSGSENDKQIKSSQVDTGKEGSQSPLIDTQDTGKNSKAASCKVLGNENVTKHHADVRPPLLEIEWISSRKFHKESSHVSQSCRSSSIPGTVTAVTDRDDDDISALSYLINGRWKLFKSLRKGPTPPPIEEGEEYIVPIKGMLGHIVHENVAEPISKPLGSSIVKAPTKTANVGRKCNDAMLAKKTYTSSENTTEHRRRTIAHAKANKIPDKVAKATNKSSAGTAVTVSGVESNKCVGVVNQTEKKETSKIIAEGPASTAAAWKRRNDSLAAKTVGPSRKPGINTCTGNNDAHPPSFSKKTSKNDSNLAGETASVPEEQGFEISF